MGSGTATESNYIMTLQNTSTSRIFAVLQGETVEIKFKYSSVDKEGMTDGPGIGTLYVNDIKKADLAISQDNNTLDITKYLFLGANKVSLTVKNSENKSKTLNYQIEVINLSLSTNFKDLDVYTGATDFVFTILGAGTKTIHYIMDDVEL
jgi:hypothetical protein